MEARTFSERNEDTKRSWRIVDADGLVLGRMATHIAISLRGKDKPTFTPHIDGGDFVVVINAEKIHLTGKKLEDKKYYDHSGYISGMRVRTAGEMIAKDPEELIRRAVWGMLPKGPLGRKMLKKLKIYRGTTHPHAAQKPTPLMEN